MIIIDGNDPVADNNGWKIAQINPENPVPISMWHNPSIPIKKTRLAIPGINTLNGAATFGGTESGKRITRFFLIKK